MKKLLFTVVCAVLTSTMLCAGAILANADNSLALEGNINFEIPESWAANNSIYYAHIWDGINFEGLYEWQTKNEKMTVDSDEKIASYYVPRGNWNLLVISSNNGEQTYDCVFNKNCINDTCYVTDTFFQNPVDEGMLYGLNWKNNPNCGPHKMVSPYAEVIGTALLPGETNQQLYDNFVSMCDPASDFYSWNEYGALTTGMTWQQAKAKVAQDLGLTAVNTISLNKSSITLGVGETYTLIKSVTPANVVTGYNWSSNNVSVVTVSNNGKITAKKAGTATITVKTDNNKTASCVVTVKKAPTSISLNKTKLTVGVGEQFDFNSSLPSGCGAYNVKYSTNNSKVAEIKAAGGLMTAKSVGTATITATAYNGKKVSCVVTVKKAPTSISLNKTKLTVGVGEQFDFNSSLPSGCGAYSVKYSTNNLKVAEVKAAGGLMTAKSVGTATITATAYNGKKVSCVVTVKKAPTSISLNKTKLTVGVGERFDFNSSLPSGCGAYSIKYSTNNLKVAEVKAAGGLMTAKSVGTATITATAYNGKKISCVVTVKKAPTSISLNKTKITVGVGEQFDFNSSLPSGCGAYSVKYSTNNLKVAEVKAAGGLMTAKSVGTATITATAYNGKKISCVVTVKKAPTSISLNKKSLKLFIGQQYDLDSILPSGCGAYSIKYSSNNNNVATVKASGGLVKAESAGSAIITATAYNGKKVTCTVNVTEIYKVYARIDIPENMVLVANEGGTATIYEKYNYEHGYGGMLCYITVLHKEQLDQMPNYYILDEVFTDIYYVAIHAVDVQYNPNNATSRNKYQQADKQLCSVLETFKCEYI